MANGLSNHFTTHVINADQVGHQVLTLSAIKQQIRERFGADVFVDAEIDRKQLAARVFGTDNDLALTQLEAIVHPEIRRQIENQIRSGSEAAQASGDDTQHLVVLDASVMFEAGWNHVCDFVVFLETPIETRMTRVKTRSWDATELTRRESNQWTLEAKRSAADAVVDNAGSLDDAVHHVKELILQRINS